MKRTILRRSGAAAAVLALSVSLAACGDDSDNGDDTASDDTSSSAPAEPSDDASMESEPAAPAADGPFGDACSAVPATGEGSVEGMTDDPVATAASNNPLLKTLVAAVTEAGLVDTLNTAEALTVFAPTDDAFAKVPEADLNALLADKDQLTAVLTHHVVGERLDPTAVVGEHETLNSDTVTVEGDPTAGMSVDGGAANVVCGNVQTANATVYVIDSVLMPTG